MLEPLAQGFALHQFRYHIARATRQRADIKQRADVGMIQGGYSARLALEPLTELSRGDLDRHGPAEPIIDGTIDLTHATLAEHADDFVRPDTSSGCQDCTGLRFVGETIQILKIAFGLHPRSATLARFY